MKKNYSGSNHNLLIDDQMFGISSMENLYKSFEYV